MVIIPLKSSVCPKNSLSESSFEKIRKKTYQKSPAFFRTGTCRKIKQIYIQNISDHVAKEKLSGRILVELGTDLNLDVAGSEKSGDFSGPDTVVVFDLK